MRFGVVAAVLLALVAGLSGCTDFKEPPATNRIGLIDIDVAAPEVSAGQVVLEVTAIIDNLEAESGELNLTVKAYDVETGMLVRTADNAVGELHKDTTTPVSARLELPRASGYRLMLLVFQDGHVVQTGQVQVLNLAALESTLHDTGLRVDQVEAQVLGTMDGLVQVRVPVYLVNEGASPSRALRLQVKAREVSTSILADEKWLDLTSIAPDATRIAKLDLQMPEGFNYELEAAVWDGEVLVERGSGHVQFLPTYTRPANQVIEVSRPDISVFGRASALTLRQDGYNYDTSEPAPGWEGASYYGAEESYDSEEDSASTPGFGLLAGTVALGAVLVILRRRL